MTESWIWAIFYFLISLSFVLVLLILFQKYQHHRKHKLNVKARDYLFNRYYDGEDVSLPVSVKFFIDAMIDVETQMIIEDDIRIVIENDLIETKFIQRKAFLLDHSNVLVRKISIHYLQQFRTKKITDLLYARFFVEKNETILFMLMNHLVHHLTEDLVNHLIKTLEKGSTLYQKWVHALIVKHYQTVKPYFSLLIGRTESSVIELLVKLGEEHLDEELKTYLINLSKNHNYQIRAYEALAKLYPEVIVTEENLNHEIEMIKKITIHASSLIIERQTVDTLLKHMDGSSFDKDRTKALSRIIYDSKSLLLYILDVYPLITDQAQKDAITRVLSHRIDFLMVQLKSGQYDYILTLIERMFELHITEDIIDFMNQNKEPSIEQKMMKLIIAYSSKDLYLLDQFSIYLSQPLLMKMGILKKPQPIVAREKPPKEKKRTTWIIRWILVSVFMFPFLYIIFNLFSWIDGTPFSISDVVITFNYYLVLYFMTVNSIYLLLLTISIYGAYERETLYKLKSQSLLFHKDLLPSISIIAPAYNEELSIVESVTALLNLKYPKFEVIVVNDGSKDQTIDILKQHFQLERKHPFFIESIPTKPLRGVYVNQRIPNLIVIDKQNGGKADALNVGINVAKHDYVCGIDADSLLEEDALLKMMSVTLDHTVPHIALGGNIVPVNGSSVDRGKIETHGLGRKPLVRFQTLEYLRAFTTGRIGWSRIKSLLIISGAFGMFERKTLTEAGGYLTSSSKLKKDTVGEDMELVVRLSKQALEQKRKFIVSYVHHANCYTELPSDFKTLLKQRNRWHRGLLDILSYHRKMVFNYKYKQPGMIGFPYFFIFEMMGPFIEVIGYLALFAGFILGLLNLGIFLLLLSVTVGLGMMISLFSLYIAEKDMKFYSTKETLLLILIAIIENFGYRQLISMHRVVSTFSALRDSGSWGAQKRQGFRKA